MRMNDYQNLAETTAHYAQPGDLVFLKVMYCSLGLAGEAGEVANNAKKVVRDDGREITPERRAKLLDEAGDTLWYVANLARELGMPLEALAQRNLDKLQARYEADPINPA